MLEPDLLEILCCPACRGELDYAPAAAELSCRPCGFTYPIVDGIPVLFPLDVKARFQELFHRSWDSEARAEVYDRFVEGGESPLDLHNHIGETRATLAVLGDLPPGRLLDCGCGNGRFFQHYPAHVTPVGFDASLNLLRICKKKGRAKRLVCGEMEHLPFKDGVFDRAVSVRVIQHLQEQELAVREISRVLRTGGEVTLHCYNELSSKAVVKHVRQSWVGKVLNWPFRALFRTLSPFAPWELAYDKYNSVPQVRRWLRRSGVRVTTVRGAGFGFNKWFMGGFLVAPWLERRRPQLLQRYLATSLRAEEAVAPIWPFNYLMEKFVLRGVKQASS
jgi:ubiquinone/menaquinone biosynthesis C-methylase UbiE